MTGKKNGKQAPDTVADVATGATSPPGEHKMEQIRELMFGSVVRDFERRLGELHDRFEAESARILADGQKRVAELEARQAAQIERLQGQLRQESAARTGALEDVDTRFGQSLRTQSNEITAALQRHEDDAVSSEARLREAMAQLEQQLTQALQGAKDQFASGHRRLGDEKLAREDMADMMAELALRLRGAQDGAGHG
ncbi:hypothetical protein [Solilutibacter silvestris]|uniref:Uncharacterized protein n=1 Tax=Solilutibacter silvestris TaxID=1645665 RepID=A0A2K1Q182_9GAMM|nr:hypothetical protein [Lysobacter silvestris]PNS08796.1 hypothetical protein Lysil_0425 [Lysobacter silvestris]